MTNMNKHIVNKHGATLNGYKEQKKEENNASPFHDYFFSSQSLYKSNDPSQEVYKIF